MAEQIILKFLREKLTTEIVHHLSARAVSHHDGGVVLERDRTGPAVEIWSGHGRFLAEEMSNCTMPYYKPIAFHPRFSGTLSIFVKY